MAEQKIDELVDGIRNIIKDLTKEEREKIIDQIISGYCCECFTPIDVKFDYCDKCNEEHEWWVEKLRNS